MREQPLPKNIATVAAVRHTVRSLRAGPDILPQRRGWQATPPCRPAALARSSVAESRRGRTARRRGAPYIPRPCNLAGAPRGERAFRETLCRQTPVKGRDEC